MNHFAFIKYFLGVIKYSSVRINMRMRGRDKQLWTVNDVERNSFTSRHSSFTYCTVTDCGQKGGVKTHNGVVVDW